jgi:hypothetical protein
MIYSQQYGIQVRESYRQSSINQQHTHALRILEYRQCWLKSVSMQQGLRYVVYLGCAGNTEVIICGTQSGFIRVCL